MKHIFIINPFAGSGEGIASLKEKLAALPFEYDIYETVKAGDATRFIRDFCSSSSEEVRFYASGGDGTVKEVAEGIVGFEHASMSVYPIGSGNDFVKFFGGADAFMDIETITSAKAEDIDIIEVSYGENKKTHSINVCNFGFEAYVADIMNKVRRKPLIGGNNAYTTGIVCGVFKSMKAKGKIYADGELINENGFFLLCTAANGGYVGGGYNCAPRASVNDGELEVCFVKPLSIFTLLRLIGIYKVGKHLEDKRFEKYIAYRRAKKVEFICEKPAAVCLDGEIVETTHVVLEVKGGAVKFAAPEEKK